MLLTPWRFGVSRHHRVSRDQDRTRDIRRQRELLLVGVGMTIKPRLRRVERGLMQERGVLRIAAPRKQE